MLVLCKSHRGPCLPLSSCVAAHQDYSRTEQVQYASSLDAQQRKKREADKALDDFCKGRASAIRDTLRSPGQNRFNDYDKSDFRDRATLMVSNGDKDAHLVSETDRDKLLAQIRAKTQKNAQ